MVIVARPDLRSAAERIGAAVWRSARKPACHGLAQNLRAREFGPAASPRLWRCSGMRNRSLGSCAARCARTDCPRPAHGRRTGAAPQRCECWWRASGGVGRSDLLDLPPLRQRERRRPAALVPRVQRGEPVGIEVADHIAGPVVAGEGGQRTRGPRPCPELTAAQT